MKRLTGLYVLLIAAQFTHAQLADSLQALAQRMGVAGLSVVAVEKGELSGVWHTGLRDVERGLPVTDSTRFRVASVSKLVTVTGLMLLYDEGKFDLDDDVSAYLGFPLRNPSYPDVPITFRMLASHTSGIRDGSAYDGFLGDTYRAAVPVPVKELFVPGGSHFSEDMWQAHPPGTYFFYCNANYGLIGTLIERMSGQRFDVFMRDRLLKPLGIGGSYAVADLDSIAQLAVLYRKTEGKWTPQADHFQGKKPEPRNLEGYQPGTNGFVFGPQGGLRISALELTRILQLHLGAGKFEGKRFLSKKAIRLMHQPTWTYNGRNGESYHNLFTCWGLGVQITQNQPGGDVIWPGVALRGHLGEAYGLLSGLFFDPKTRSGFIFMLNGWENPEKGTYSSVYLVEEEIIRMVREAVFSTE